MLALPVRVAEDEYDVWLILAGKDIEEIKHYDPSEFRTDLTPAKFREMRLRNVVVAYASREDVEILCDMMRQDRPMDDVLCFLARGAARRIADAAGGFYENILDTKPETVP